MEHTNSPAILGAAIRKRRSDLGLTQARPQSKRLMVVGKETVQLAIALDAAQALGLNVGIEARGEADS